MMYTNFWGKALYTSGSISKSIYGTSATEKLIGTSGNDAIFANGGADTLSGGSGDDTYYIISGKEMIVEAGGIDTIAINNIGYRLSDSIENMTISGAGFGIGNAGANVIKGSAASQVIEGAGGDDVLVGGGGHDSFVFKPGSGYDVVTDFTAASGAEQDVIRVGAYTGLTDFAALKAHMTQQANGTVVSLSSTDSILLSGVAMSSLSEPNFHFGVDVSKLQQTFVENFNNLSLWTGQAGSGTWRTDFGYGGSTGALGSRTLASNGEKEIYADPGLKGTSSSALGINPFSIHDGVLDITARATTQAEKASLWGYDFVSGLLTTKESFAQLYGYFEINAKLPDGYGSWPAFWLLPADGTWPPELDVFEAYNGSGLISATEHSKGTGVHTTVTVTSYVPDSTTAFHKYGMLWDPNHITFYIDGVETGQVDTPKDMHKPMYMLVDLALTSATIADPAYSETLSVDYVKAYALPSAGSAVVTPIPIAATASATVTSTAALVLTTGQSDGMLTGTAAVSLTGNALGNHLVGNSAANNISGGVGNDVIQGGGGTDYITGGSGADTFVFQGSDLSDIRKGGSLIQIGDFKTLDGDIVELQGFGHGHIEMKYSNKYSGGIMIGQDQTLQYYTVYDDHGAYKGGFLLKSADGSTLHEGANLLWH